MEYSNQTFSHRLTTRRVQANISREILAQNSGVSVEVLGQYEKGVSTPSLDSACALAIALGCSIDELAGLPLPADRKQSV